MEKTSSRTVVSALAVAAAIACFGCGGTAPEPEEPTEAEATEVGTVQEIAPPDDGMQTEGLLGNIPQSEVEKVFSRHMDSLGECYGKALDTLESIEGSIEIGMEIDLSGRVSQSYIMTGDLGSLKAETCILNKVGRFNFPRPGGGKAVVSHPLIFEAPYDPPMPASMSTQQAHSTVETYSADMERCLGGNSGVTVTLYVGTDGQVISSGAAAESYEMYEAARCLAEAASSWSFSDPVAKTAKLSLAF